MAEYTNTAEELGESEYIDRMINRTLTELVDDRVTTIGRSALAWSNIAKAYFPKATAIMSGAFYFCSNLVDTCFPEVISIEGSTFYGCRWNLSKLDFPKLRQINGENAFYYCPHLKTLILRNTEQICTLANVNAFAGGTPIGSGYIYVPSALLNSYKAATNWSTYAARFRVLEDWTDDGTVTGELVSYIVALILSGVTNSNNATETGNSYYAVLASDGSEPISTVTITMGGVDVTQEVYNAETGEINIPLVTGDLVITAKAQAPASGDVDLPDDYTAVSYIAAVGTVTGQDSVTGPYINTGIKPTNTLSIQCSLAMLGASGDTSYSGAVHSNNQGWLAMGSYGDGKLSAFFCSGSRSGATIAFDNDFHEYLIENGHQSIDGANDTYVTASVNFPDAARLYLLSHWIGFSGNHAMTSAMAWCKIWDNGELIKDYVACIRDSDGAIGMYDRVTGEFVGNSGSGEFTAGDVISGGNTVSCEHGAIDWTTGAESDNTARIRTDFIPYSAAVNTFSVSAQVNGSETLRVLLRQYDSDCNFLYDDYPKFESVVISPATVAGWAANNTEYTIKYGTDVAYVRAVFAAAADSEITSFSGKITVSGVEYDLVWED